MIPAAFEYVAPQSVKEVIELLEKHGDDAKILAGGHSLLPIMKLRLAQPKLLVDIGRIGGLDGIKADGQRVVLGALATHDAIEQNALLKDRCPLLPETAAVIGDMQVRNRGTLGGSLAHADPAAELPCLAVTCGAQIVALGGAGARVIAAAEFFRGALQTALRPDEIITEIRFPAWPRGRRSGFREFARRRGDFALAAAAVSFDLAEQKSQQSAVRSAANVRIGVIGVADRPLRLGAAEAALEGRDIGEKAIIACAAAACAAVDPTDDIHASGAYRKTLIGVMVERALRDAMTAPIV